MILRTWHLLAPIVAAIVAAFRSPSRVPKPSVRTWQEVANETVEAVTDSMGVGAHAS